MGNVLCNWYYVYTLPVSDFFSHPNYLHALHIKKKRSNLSIDLLILFCIHEKCIYFMLDRLI